MKTLVVFVGVILGALGSLSARIWTITPSGLAWSPSSLTLVSVGDTIRWVGNGGFHNTTSTTIPSGAASWSQDISQPGATFDYVVRVAGTYNYTCTNHPGMNGSFTASGVSVANSLTTPDTQVAVYPNPFRGTITVDINGNNPYHTIEVYDIMGNQVLRQTNIHSTNTLNTSELAPGVYFIKLIGQNRTDSFRRLKN